MQLQNLRRFSIPAAIAVAALPALATAQLAPPPSPVFHSKVAQCQSTVAGNTSNSHSDPHQVVYGPQAGWVILNYNVYNVGSYGVNTENWSSAPAGSFASYTDFQNAYTQAFNAVASANIPSVAQAQIEASLTTSYSVNSAYAMNLASSFGNITLNTDAWGQDHGWTQFQAGSAATLGLDVWLLPVETCMTSGAQYKSWILSWTTNSIAAAKKKTTGLQWEQLLATSYARMAVGLGQIGVHSAGGLTDRNLRELLSTTCKTMGWADFDVSVRFPIPPIYSEATVHGQKSGQPVTYVALTKEQVLSQIKGGTSAVGRN